MKKQEAPPEELAENIYEKLPWPKVKIILAVGGLFLFSFLCYFSLPALIAQSVKNAIDANRSCTMIYRSLEFEYFLPKIVIRDLVLGSNCFDGQMPLGQVSFDRVTAKILYPSFWPVGITAKLELKKNKQNLGLKVAAGIGGMVFKIHEKKLNLQILNDILGLDSLEGHLAIDVLAKLKFVRGNLQPETADVRLESTDLLIKSFNLNGLQLPLLPLKNLGLKLSLDKNQNLTLENLGIGNENSPFKILGSGKAHFNWNSLPSSELDFSLEAIFTDAFLQDFAVLPMMLASYPKNAEGWYQIKIAGPLSNYME